MDELAELITEQERDRRFGDRMHSISLDADRMYEWLDASLGEGLVPRRERATKRIKGLVGYRTRERQRRRKYGAVCGCGAVTDGSNGRAKAPKRCAKCVQEEATKKRDALPHGSIQKYRAGCRCQECRWENARHAWDIWQRRKVRNG